jgi:pimeloyl-ACP methyl ester carboxylesterase
MINEDFDTKYIPARPPISARWVEWSALLGRMPETPEKVKPDEAIRSAAAAAGPVLVLPGIAAADGQTTRLRRHLHDLGFLARGWGMGVNIGPTRRVLDRLSALVTATADKEGPINLVGLSMGGLFSRWVAQHHAPLVRQVITVCSPFRSPLDSFFLPLRQIAPLWPCDVAAFVEAVSLPPRVPATYLYTTMDGMVAWASCLDPENPADCFEFRGAHMTMPSNPAVWSLVAKRLVRSLN